MRSRGENKSGALIFRRIAGQIGIFLIFAGIIALQFRQGSKGDTPQIDDPLPALGQAVANAVHAAVTDPYFKPLERIARFLDQQDEPTGVTVELVTKFAPDPLFPTCFVLDMATGQVKMDRPASPWALEMVVDRVRQGVRQDNPDGRLVVSVFQADGDDHWLGFIRNPPLSPLPDQVIGVFFNIPKYLTTDVPRMIDELFARRRFPLFPFESADLWDTGGRAGHIAFRILREDGSVYLQRGETFDKNKLIYSESAYYDQPVVCLQRGWDLQVFSRRAGGTFPDWDLLFTAMINLVGLALVSVIFWWAAGKRDNSAPK